MESISTRVKICGLTTLADARFCAGAGADYLGFIQYPSSPRYIPPEQAKEIIGWIYGPEAVGVFVNETVSTLNETAAFAGFSLVQVHGDQPPAYFADIEKPVIKAIQIAPETTLEDLKKECERYAPYVDYFLLDTAKAGMWGGTGTSFNWDLAASLVQEYSIFIAGGITPDNVPRLLDTLTPFAIDIASGVESAPGVKDFDKIAQLFDTLASLS